MKKNLILSFALAPLFSSAAGAVTIENKDSSAVTVTVESDGVKTPVRMMPGQTNEYKDKAVVFVLGDNPPVGADGSDRLVITDGNIVMESVMNGKFKTAPKSDVAPPKPPGTSEIK